MEIKNTFNKRNIGDNIYCEIDLSTNSDKTYMYFQESFTDNTNIVNGYSSTFLRDNEQWGQYKEIDFKEYDLPITNEYFVTHSFLRKEKKLIIMFTKILTD